jgi:imidazolonepropionase-like amidohydrolase
MNIELAAIHLTLMYKKGLTAMAALESATINAARFCGLDQRVGSLEPGKDADVVIWDVEPLATLSQAGIVIIDGQIAYRRKAGESNVDYQKL